MKHKTTVVLLINGLLLSSATWGQNQGNNPQNKQFGAPNSVRTQGQQNRQTIRQPLGSNTNPGQKPQSGSNRESNSPQTGMTQAKKGPSIVKTLGLNKEQAQKLHAAHKKMEATAKRIHGNNALSEEEKKAPLHEAYKKHQEKLAEFLSEEQLAKLRAIHRQNAKPQPKPNQNKPKPGEHIAKVLGLSKEQEAKLRSARESANKKVDGIVKNKELNREQKREQIEEVRSTLWARRNEVLTVEQQNKLEELHAATKAQREEQAQKSGRENPGNPGSQRNQTEFGFNEERLQLGKKKRPQGGGQQKGRPQQGGGQQKGRPQQGGGQQPRNR